MTAVANTGTRKRVLIVDDDRDFSAAIGEILDSEGYSVALAHNAEDALAHVSTEQVHVALLDIRLGRDSGIDLIPQFQARQAHILCVVMTGHAAVETAIQALQEGAYNYLRKPVDGTDLLATLARCFETIVLREEKAEAEQHLSVRNRELEALTVRLRNIVESVRRLTACADVEKLLSLLLYEVAGDIGAQRGRLFVTRDGRMRAAESTATDGSPHGGDALINGSTLATLNQSKKPLLVRNSSETPELLPDGWEPTTPESMLMLPLFGEQESLMAVIVLFRGVSQPFSEQDGELASLLSSVCSEILRSTASAQAVATGEQRYRLLADNVADIIWTIDVEGMPTFISPSVLSMRGYTVAEAMSQTLEERMSNESAGAVRTLLNTAINGGTQAVQRSLANMELEMRHRDGHLVVTETNFSALSDEQGEFVGLLCVSRDISDRKRSEAAQSRLAAAVEYAAESIMITEPDGTIQYVNPAFEHLTGYSRADAIGQTPRLIQSGKHDELFYRELWETLARGDVWTGRFTNRTKSGRLTEEEATISAIRDSRGNTINYVSVARDVTHEVELERKLRQAQKMEAIGTLAGGIAHDFNNMLSPILGYAELAMTEVDPSSELYFSLSEISAAGKRASELVQQILAFGRRSEQDRVAVSISSIMKEALRLLRGSLPSTIQIRQDIRNCAPVMADSTEIHQVIMNLCTNAYHAMRDDGGTLTVGLVDLSIRDEQEGTTKEIPPGEYVQLTIEDTGHGMDQETLERIFEPYFTTKRVGEGTGLGLATVHGIVQSHFGKVMVESTLGEGTCFSIYFPAAPSEPPLEIEPGTTNAVASGSERILVVDDEVAIVSMLKRGLGSLGYSVTGFRNGADALDAFTAEPDAYDLIITDQTMPKLTGLELARRVSAIRPGFPIILATGFSDTVNEQIAVKSGIREFLFKPTSPRVIADHVRRILDEVESAPE